MPLYEYRCTRCGHRFEKIQSFSAPDEKECPRCGAPVERLISAPALQFKGSGFYLTDYGKSGGGAKGGDGGEKSNSSAGEKSGGSGGEKSSSSGGEKSGGTESKPSAPASTPAPKPTTSS